MYGKKTFLVFALLFLSGIILFSDDLNIENINGTWMTSRDLELSLNRREEREKITYFFLAEEWFIILWDDVTKKGIFQTGSQQNTIRNIEVAGKRVKLVFLLHGREDFFEREIVLEYITRDLFRIVSSPFNGFTHKPDYLCRIGDFAKKPQAKGKINNYGVRFRNKPELTGDVWFKLDFGEEVEIIGVSEKKQTIGELEAYWYEVRINYPDIIGDGVLDGWVFGAYLDVENRAALEEKLKKLRTAGR